MPETATSTQRLVHVRLEYDLLIPTDATLRLAHDGTPVGFVLADGGIVRPIASLEVEDSSSGTEEFTVYPNESDLDSLGIEVVGYTDIELFDEDGEYVK